MSKIGKIKTIFKGQQQRLSYVLINIFMALTGFIKSYVIMKYLDFYEVGMIAMVQSVIEFVSMLQLGLLSGAFRMYFINTFSVNKRINSMLFSYFGVLVVVLLLVVAIFTMFTGGINLKSGLLLFAGLIGIFTLAKTWLSNLLIAAQELNKLNKLNTWSSLLSLLFLFLVPSYGLIACILLIASQPVIFILSALWQNPRLRPQGITFRRSLLRKMWLFGFIPFLAGVLVKVDDQVERWGIINTLGLEELGKYNLVLIYCSVFMLIPASINPIFFPKTIIQYKDNDIVALKRTMKQYVLILFGYAILAFICTFLFMPYFVNLLLPKYNVGIPYLWYIFPYLLAQILIMPLDFIYTVVAKYKIMFISYSVGVVLFVVLVIWISRMQVIKLEYFPIAKSIDGACFLLVSYIGYYILDKVKKSIFK